ncbi:MAG: MarR family winged helix-turn-helix transcriptional regulator [Acidobacteriaceae bacterium]
MSRAATPLPFATTLRVRDSCLCLHLQRAARVLARRFDDALRPLQLTNGQFSLLMSLHRPHPPGMAPVAALLGMDRTTLTAALKPLARRGLLKITPDPSHRRSRLLHLTAQGRNLLARAVPLWERTSRHVETLLGNSNPDRLRKNLRTLS